MRKSYKLQVSNSKLETNSKFKVSSFQYGNLEIVSSLGFVTCDLRLSV